MYLAEILQPKIRTIALPVKADPKTQNSTSSFGFKKSNGGIGSQTLLHTPTYQPPMPEIAEFIFVFFVQIPSRARFIFAYGPGDSASNAKNTPTEAPRVRTNTLKKKKLTKHVATATPPAIPGHPPGLYASNE